MRYVLLCGLCWVVCEMPYVRDYLIYKTSRWYRACEVGCGGLVYIAWALGVTYWLCASQAFTVRFDQAGHHHLLETCWIALYVLHIETQRTTSGRSETAGSWTEQLFEENNVVAYVLIISFGTAFTLCCLSFCAEVLKKRNLRKLIREKRAGEPEFVDDEKEPISQFWVILLPI